MNLKGKSKFIPRRHQLECENRFRSIMKKEKDFKRSRTSPNKYTLLYVTTGGGKSSTSIGAAQLVKHGYADKICVLTPKLSLKEQGEKDFIKKEFQEYYDVEGLEITQSKNDKNPSKGTNGYITTCQAIVSDKDKIHLKEFKKHRYILIVDENHHICDPRYVSVSSKNKKNQEELEMDIAWYKAIKPLVDEAKYVIFMTGSMERGDKNRIAFLPYKETEKNEYVIDEDDESFEFIKYNRSMAILEEAIIRANFHFNTGSVEWIEGDDIVSIPDMSQCSTKDARKSLWTAIKTEMASAIIEKSVDSWCYYKETVNSLSQMIIVAHRISYAEKFKIEIEEYLKSIQKSHYRCVMATSADDDALTSIQEFKEGKFDILITVQMASEGLDVPSVSHMAILTNIRTKTYIEQLIGRAVRTDYKAIRNGVPYKRQVAEIFVPMDRLMVEIAKQIREEQVAPAITHLEEKIDKTDGSGISDSEIYFDPVSSEYKRTIVSNLEQSLTAEDFNATQQYLHQELKCFDAGAEYLAHKILQAQNNLEVLEKYKSDSFYTKEAKPKLTDSEIRKKLNEYINKYGSIYYAIRTKSIQNSDWTHASLNQRITKYMKKSRSDMSKFELFKSIEFIFRCYPYSKFDPSAKPPKLENYLDKEYIPIEFHHLLSDSKVHFYTNTNSNRKPDSYVHAQLN